MGTEEPAVIGIQETKDVVAFALGLGSGISEAMKDGSVGLADLPVFLEVAAKLPSAISGISAVPTELSHLDEAEKAELFQFVQDNFDIENDKVEGAIIDGLGLVSGIYDYVQKYFVKAADVPPAA